VSCAGANVLTADLMISVGTLALEQSCQLLGTAQAGGQARIAGSVIAHGALSAQSLTTSQSSMVRKSDAIVGAATLTDSSQVPGNLSAESLVTTGSSQVTGSITRTPALPRSAPTVPRWVDFSYNKPDWTGFVKKSVFGVGNFLSLQPLVVDVSSPVLIDARGCIGQWSPGAAAPAGRGRRGHLYDDGGDCARNPAGYTGLAQRLWQL
jgi:hypothetical protein